MSRRLHGELTLAFFLLTTLLLASIFGFLALHVRQSMLDQTIEHLQRDAFVVRALVADAAASPGWPGSADGVADRWGRELGLRVTLIARDGRVLGDSALDGPQLAAVENHADRSEVHEALQRGLGHSIRKSQTIHQTLLYLAVPFGDRGVPQGVVRLAVPIRRIERSQVRLIQLFLGAFGVATLGAFGIGWIVSRRVSRPVRQMLGVAQAMAAGDFQQRIRVATGDEMGELAEGINTLASHVEARFSEVTAAKHQLEGIIEGFGEGLVVTDAQQRIVLVNPAFTKLFGLTEPAQGRPLLDVIRYPKIADIVQRAAQAGGASLRDEALMTGVDERWVRLHAAGLFRHGVCHGVVCVIHDVTDLRRLERVRRDFVANVSHELRTPLTSIRGYVETLRDGAIADPVQAREFLEVIYQEADRLARMIEELLDISRLESGALPLDLRPLALRPILDHIVQTLRPSLEHKALIYREALPDPLPMVMADARAVYQIFLNLLDNAIKYTPAHGAITVTARRRDAGLEIGVSDTGIGIPAEHLPRIFERFYRVDKSRSVELGGTGLGLAIVKHFVQAQQGQVRVESTPGQGSTFSFTLPLSDAV